MNSTVCENIPDQDLIYLQREISRYNASIDTLQASRQFQVDEAQGVSDKTNSGPLDTDDLHQLEACLKAICKYLDTDIPRIKKNIDSLEAFTVKALRNKLNEDNKKSQGLITQMKKNYDDLQKEIDALNSKLVTVRSASKAMQDKLEGADLEKENEIKNRISDKLNDCDRDINGDQAERAAPAEERGRDRPLSLQARKKDIIGMINKLVNTFNDNNKLIKDSIKAPKTEEEMNEMISKNQDIQNKCKDIEKTISDGMVFAEQINERLNTVLDPTIPEIGEKYASKNELID